MNTTTQAPGLSGKDASGENFPVAATLLLGRANARGVAAYYAFARMADDIADSPDLPEAEKLTALGWCRQALKGAVPPGSAPVPISHGIVTRCADMLRHHGLPASLAADLLTAFEADARNTPCRTLDDLMAYCRSSAMPVGRFLLALCDTEPRPEAVTASDGLCAALQILNHVQDWRADRDTLGRVYLPVDVTTAPEADIRTAIGHCLALAEAQLAIAAPLPKNVTHGGLRRQARMTLWLAHRLLHRLRTGDPYVSTIGLSRADKVQAALFGWWGQP